MFFIEEKREKEIVEGYEEQPEPAKSMILDFAYILYIGMSIGYSEKEIGHMYFGKWAKLNDRYKKQWNMQMRKILFPEPEAVVSVLDL